MLIDRYASTVVDDPQGTVRQNCDFDSIAITGKCFVDGVVNNLVNEVMKASFCSGTDVHSRSFANGLEALENLNVVRTIFRGFRRRRGRCVRLRNDVAPNEETAH